MTASDSRRRALKILSLLTAVLLSEVSVDRGHAYPADENIVGESEIVAYPMSYAHTFQQESSPHHHNPIDKPKGCFHFYVSRNMSSLLSEATKMLQHVRDRREREWLLTFIYRIKSLAEHLRTHPESRNYDCLSSEEDNRRRNSPLGDRTRTPQQELYFVDDLQPNHSKRSGGSKESPSADAARAPSPEVNANLHTDNQQSPTGVWREQSMGNVPPQRDSENFNSVVEPSSTRSVEPAPQDRNVDSIPTASAVTQSELKENSHQDLHQPDDGANQSAVDEPSLANKQSYDNVIVISSPPDCEQNAECEEALNRHLATNGHPAADGDDLLVQDLHPSEHEKNMEDDRMQQTVLKRRIRKALLEEMAPEVKKLRTVGGTEKDLINLWKQSEGETGKSTDNYYDGDFDYEEIGAAAGDLNSNDGLSSFDQTVAPSVRDMKNFKKSGYSGRGTKSYEPYDDSDVLVKQLFDVRFEQTPSKTTKSLNEQQEEYLITSTHIPY